ncbi:MAG: ComEC family competence protein [Alphaproteobacteria bacterium]|nr:MAG: ComEC family competence protein [Alphaproteobacteria bacterium]
MDRRWAGEQGVASRWTGRLLETEQRQFVLWLPVLFGCGIGLYFMLPDEPPVWTAPAGLAAALTLWLGLRRAGLLGLGVSIALLAVAAGYADALWRAHRVAAPVLERPLEVSVEGRVREITRSSVGRPRLLIDRVVLYGLPAARWPARVRLTIAPEDLARGLAPGMRIIAHARLMPPGRPVEPGGFDFRRTAWFDRLGAVGFARGAVLAVAAPPAPAWQRPGVIVAQWRAAISAGLRARLAEPQGSIAAAILVGDKSGIPEEATAALRASNLAHLLAISGLHMGLLTGFVFFTLRAGLALIPPLALRLPIKRVAALAAMLAGLVYLVLSGASVATQRSFIMMLVVFAAVLLDRPAISLRAVALAAAIVLALRPESLVEVGFQMSFAATTALVGVFDWLRARRLRIAGPGLMRRVAVIALSSLVAGLATAPFSAYAFNQSAAYGLPANLAAIPLMGLWIMPAGAIAAVLAPFGLEALPLAVMGQGIALVLEVARFFAGLDGAVQRIPATTAPVLLPIALGGLWLLLWRSPMRLAGLAGILAGLVWWQFSTARPVLIVAESGRQLGLDGPKGRVILNPKRERYAALRWLMADGDDAAPEDAASRPGFERGRGWARARIGRWRVEVLTARRPDATKTRALCTEGVLLVAGGLRQMPKGGCLAVTGPLLRREGALAFYDTGRDLVMVSAQRRGRRLWSGAAR